VKEKGKAAERVKREAERHREKGEGRDHLSRPVLSMYETKRRRQRNTDKEGGNKESTRVKGR